MKTLKQMYEARKRWSARMFRAVNEVRKLDGQIRRAEMRQDNPKPKADAELLKQHLEVLSPPITDIDLDVTKSFLARGQAAQAAVNKVIAEAEPQLVDKLKAKRPPVDKTAMPLSGRAALDAIKAKSEEVTARRKKRKLA